MIVVGIMTIPMVSSLSDDALHAVPQDLREAAYGVGATKFEVTTRVVYPAALSGVTASYIRLSSNGCGWVEARSSGRRGVLAARVASELTAHGVHLTGGGRGAPWPGVGRSGVAAGRPACQRATRVLRCATALRVTHRPSLRSSSRYGPCGPAWTGASGHIVACSRTTMVRLRAGHSISSRPAAAVLAASHRARSACDAVFPSGLPFMAGMRRTR